VVLFVECNLSMHLCTCKCDNIDSRVLQLDSWCFKAVHHYPPASSSANISEVPNADSSAGLIIIHKYNLLVRGSRESLACTANKIGGFVIRSHARQISPEVKYLQEYRCTR